MYDIITNKWVGLTVGLIFTALVIGLITFRILVVDPIVPKPRAWNRVPIPVHVCPGAKLSLLEEAAILVPTCAYSFRVMEPYACMCPTVSSDWSQVEKPLGYVEVHGGPSDGHEGALGWTAYRVQDPMPWTNPETDQVEPSGIITGASVVIPATGGFDVDLVRVAAHELAHVCGYAHAVGDPTSPTVRLHLMSGGHEYQGEDSRGMDLETNEFGNLGDGMIGVSDATRPGGP